MTVKLGIMELPVTQDADRVRDYLNGTIADGGLWTALGRASDHDHTGGLNGKPIAVSSIPDGSITAGKLDPSVLLPYALVDGSKPFTGQVVADADLLVRDTLYFGAKPAGTGDANLRRTGANAFQFSGSLGVGVAPAAWGGGIAAVSVGTAQLFGNPAANSSGVRGNSYYDGTNNRAIITGPAVDLELSSGIMSLLTAPSVAAGAAQTFTTRLTVDGLSGLSVNGLAAEYKVLRLTSDGILRWQAGLDPAHAFHIWSYNDAGALTGDRLNISRTGTVTLTPDAAQDTLVGSPELRLRSSSGSIFISSANNIFCPINDNTITCGYPSFRWNAVYAVNGSIQTSSADMKQDITPLDPAACAAAVLETDWVSFSYLPPAPPEYVAPADIAYDEHDNNEVKAEKAALRDAAEAASKAAYAKMLVETQPARDQRGYVLGSAEHQTSDLFGLSDRKSASSGSDLAVVACALQDALKRIAALEGTAA